MQKPILEIKDLTKHFPIKGGILNKQVGNVHAVNGISLQIHKGETLGLVGESGCGKSTLGRTILQLYKPTGGSILFNNTELTLLKNKQLKQYRKDMQIIFQDPYESLNSRHTIEHILEEPFIVHNEKNKKQRKHAVATLLERVGLTPQAAKKFPHEFSGGQRQRIGIARALALNPQLIICDEPVSALDVSIQSQIINLLLDLQKDLKLTYLFISHDLTVVRHISDKVAVMYLGKIVEITDSETIYNTPLHPYTKALISAIPIPDPSRKKQHIVLQGDVPSPINLPGGCSFHTRCPYAKEKCKITEPGLASFKESAKENSQHMVACHYVQEINKL